MFGGLDGYLWLGLSWLDMREGGSWLPPTVTMICSSSSFLETTVFLLPYIPSILSCSQAFLVFSKLCLFFCL